MKEYDIIKEIMNQEIPNMIQSILKMRDLLWDLQSCGNCMCFTADKNFCELCLDNKNGNDSCSCWEWDKLRSPERLKNE